MTKEPAGEEPIVARLGLVPVFPRTQYSQTRFFYFFALRPSATRKIALFPLACGEKKFTTSSS